MISLLHKIKALSLDWYFFTLFLITTSSFPKIYKICIPVIVIFSLIQFARYYKKLICANHLLHGFFFLSIYSIVFAKSIHTIYIVICLISCLFIFLREKSTLKVKKTFNSAEINLVLFFLLILGNYLIFSSDLNGVDTFFYLLIYPLLFFGFRQIQFSIDLFSCIRVFILSVVISTILLFFINGFDATLNFKTNTFFSEALEITHVYFGLFIGLSCCFILGLNYKKQSVVNPIFDHVLLIIFVLILMHVGARMALIGVFLVVGLYLYYLLPFSRYFKIFSVLGICSLLLSGSYYFIPRVKQDLNYINRVYISVKTDNKEDLVVNSWRNMYQRFLVIFYTQKEIKDHPALGIGMPNVTTEVSNQIINDGFIYFKPLNTHNQYLHYLVGMGIVGFLFFCWILYYFFTRQTQGVLGLFFILFFMTTMLSESVLVRVKGIALFFLFYLLLCTKKSPSV